MARVPEAEIMEGDEQARAYAEANFAQPHAFALSVLRRAVAELAPSGIAADLGCGPADRRSAR